jgi:hypothetical protein
MRIRQSISDDPALAIGSAKEMVETVLKIAIGDDESQKRDIPELLFLAQQELGLHPKDVPDAIPGADALRRTLGSLGQIVNGGGEIRNLYGTGHGRVYTRELEIADARLVVNAAITVATYFLELAADNTRSRRR